jgi:molecular chaperone IbpA
LAEDRYQISAIAGFSPDEVSIAADQNVATIQGSTAEKQSLRKTV